MGNWDGNLEFIWWECGLVGREGLWGIVMGG